VFIDERRRDLGHGVGVGLARHDRTVRGPFQDAGRGAAAQDQEAGQHREGRRSRHRRSPLRIAAASASAILILAAGAVKGQTPPTAPARSPPAPAATALGPRTPISLADAVFIGLRDNRTVKSAYITRVSEKFDLFVARSRFQPTALLSGSFEADRDSGVASTTTNLDPTATWLIPTGAQFQFSWSHLDMRGGGLDEGSDTFTANVAQPLLKGAGIAVNMAPIRVAELQEKINQLTLKSTVIDTVTNIILAYRALLEAQQQLVIAQDSLDRSRAQLAINQALIDAGRMAASELVQTQADIANQQVALLESEQARNSAQLALLRLLAMDLHTDIVAGDSLSVHHVGIDLDKAIATALDNRPDYLSQRRALEQARQNLLVARNNRLWNLSAVGGVQYQTFRGGLAPGVLANGLPASIAGTSASVGVQLTIPIGDHTLAQAEVQATTALRTQEMTLDDLRQEIETQVRDAVQGVELTWRRVEAAREARDLAARTLDLEREKLRAGRTSNFEVLSFETNLRAADTQSLEAAISYLNAMTQLDQQLGTTLDTWKIALNA
jgi:outer membrane protein TolC